MTYPVRLLRSAQADLDEAMRWYRNFDAGLEKNFLLHIEETLEHISHNPLAYACVDGEFRRAMPHRFPFAVFYRLHHNEAIVTAITHTSRHPRVWKSRGH